MAGRLSLPEVDLSCPICCEIFRDPVVLKCSHSFCSACLQQYWAGHRRRRDCPLCRCQSREEPVSSLTLRNLCQALIEGGEAGAEAEDSSCEPGELCSVHGEKLKLFCLQDKRPICVVCHTSRGHKQHDCCPTSEAVDGIKEEMKLALATLQERKKAFDKIKKNYECTAAHIQTQAQSVAQRTHEEFEKLHSFLRAEEEARMEELRAEEESKSAAIAQEIQKVTEIITSVSETIGALEEEMAATDEIALLQNCKRTLERASSPVEEPVPVPALLIDVAKYVGSLRYHVWQKMQQMVKYTPVTLDPNTAAPWLQLSDDLTSISDCDDKQKLPENPERFDPDAAVLGHQSFTSGRHTWDIHVGENTAWVVGVAKGSVLRKEKVSSVLKHGYLTVYFYHKMYFAGTSPLTRLGLKRNPQRIRLQLDCDKGRLDFYNADDNSLIYTFKHSFSEAVFPYLWVGCKRNPLKIEPARVSVQVEGDC